MKKRIFALLTAIMMIACLLPINVLATETHEHTSDGSCIPLDGATHTYTCDSCGEEITEDCVFERETYTDFVHGMWCIHCENSISLQAHTLVNCECEGCNYKGHVSAEWTPSTDDPNKHTGVCSVCQQNVAMYHDCTWMFTETEHWFGCECGSEISGNRGEHTFSNWYPDNGIQHYTFCDVCGYEEIEPHVDSDGNGVCDIETCGETVCVDANNDHRCDDCNSKLTNLCVDANGDHACDVAACGKQMDGECTDEDGDHTCDVAACSRHMKVECCEDEDGDYICDICERNCCDHEYVDYAVNNNDGTHTGVCAYCNNEVRVDCEDWGSDWDNTYHYVACYCGYTFLKEAHTYEAMICYARSVGGHWIECDTCMFHYYEAHTESSGTCEICESEMAKSFEIYVGGLGLENGQYLDNGGNVTATKPEGGYAYYKDGVLELNGFAYEGEGVLWRENDYLAYSAAVFAAKDLILILTGENRLYNTTALVAEEDFNAEGDGIAVSGSLTVKGEGSLTVLASGDGFDVNNGSFIMESGTLTLGVLEYKEDGSVLRDEEIGDDAIDVDNGDLSISGGTLNIYANDHGLDVSGSITISGGIVNINVGDDGIESDKDVTIIGGKINIKASDEMIIGSSVTISTVVEEEDSSNGTVDNGNGNTDGSSSNSNNENSNGVGDDNGNSAIGNEVTNVESDRLSGGAIAGIAAGSVVVAECGGFSLFWFVIKKKKLSDLIGLFK